jgi:hypothetical protein
MRRAVLLVAFSVAGAGCAGAAATSANRVGATTGVPSAPSTVVLNPGFIWFDPPGDAQPQLTSSEAMAIFEQADPEFNPSAEPVAQLGLYTAYVANGTYRFKDALAWGFTWHQCAPTYGMAPPVGAVVSCTAWLFLDANTGEMFELTWQQDSEGQLAWRYAWQCEAEVPEWSPSGERIRSCTAWMFLDPREVESPRGEGHPSTWRTAPAAPSSRAPS